MLDNLINEIEIQNLPVESSKKVKNIILDLLKIIYSGKINQSKNFLENNEKKFNDLKLTKFKVNDSLNIFDFEGLLKEISLTGIIKDVNLNNFLGVKNLSDEIKLDDNEYFYKGVRESQFIFEQILGKIVVNEETTHFTNLINDALRYSKGRNIDIDSSGLIIYINKVKLLSKNILIFSKDKGLYKIADKKDLKYGSDLFLASGDLREELFDTLDIKGNFSNQKVIPLDCIDYFKRIK